MIPRLLNGQIHPADILQAVDDLFEERFQNPIHQRFKEEAEAAGYEVVEYNGRHGWFGPCVKVSDVNAYHEFIQVTDILLKWDSLGKTGRIIYPK